MDTIDDLRPTAPPVHAVARLAIAFLAVYLLVEFGQGQSRADRPARRDVPTVAELTGRDDRQSPPGRYVDMHAPLEPWEAHLVRGYRAPRD